MDSFYEQFRGGEDILSIKKKIDDNEVTSIIVQEISLGYTIGHRNNGLPDLMICADISPDEMLSYFQLVWSAMKSRKQVVTGVIYDADNENKPLLCVPIDFNSDLAKEHLGAADVFYNLYPDYDKVHSDGVQMIQILLFDDKNHAPLSPENQLSQTLFDIDPEFPKDFINGVLNSMKN